MSNMTRPMHHKKRITEAIGGGMDDRPSPRMSPKRAGVAVLADIASTERTDEAGYTCISVVDTADDPDLSYEYLGIPRAETTRPSSIPFDQHLVVISGEGALQIVQQGEAAQSHDIAQGDVILLPRDTSHRLHAGQTGPLRLARLTYARHAPSSDNRRSGAHEVRVVHVADRVDAEFLIIEGLFITELANFELSPALSTDKARVDAGVTAAEHLLAVDERYLLLSGCGHVEVGGQRYAIAPGDMVSIPAGTPQRIIADGGETIIFYCVCTPRFDPDDFEVSIRSKGAGGPVVNIDEVDYDWIKQVHRGFGGKPCRLGQGGIAVRGAAPIVTPVSQNVS